MTSNRTNPEDQLNHRTNLCPYHFRQSSQELRRCIHTQLDSLLVENSADGQPQSRLETLRKEEPISKKSPLSATAVTHLLETGFLTLLHWR